MLCGSTLLVPTEELLSGVPPYDSNLLKLTPNALRRATRQ
jgi:hypothetical protein